MIAQIAAMNQVCKLALQALVERCFKEQLAGTEKTVVAPDLLVVAILQAHLLALMAYFTAGTKVTNPSFSQRLSLTTGYAVSAGGSCSNSSVHHHLQSVHSGSNNATSDDPAAPSCHDMALPSTLLLPC